MKKFQFFAITVMALFIFASCGNKKPAPEPEVVIEVNSETDFSAQLTIEQISVAKPYFNIEKWSGQITVDQKSGIATVTSGAKTVKISPPAGFALTNVYSKADAVRVEGKVKVKNAKGKETEKAVGYFIFADSNRKKGAQVKNKTIQDFNTTEVAVVSLKPVAAKAEKTVLKKDAGNAKILRDVPPPATK